MSDPKRIEEALALLERYGEGALGATQAAETVRAALREAQAENERLREFAETTEEWAYEQGFDGLAERARAALAASAPADEAKP